MQLSNETLTILKNFGNINQGIYFKSGNFLRTVSPYKTILAEAKIEEDIPNDCAIYDLNNFLSVVSLHKDIPSLEFDDKHVLIVGKSGRSKIRYRFCDPTMIITPPDKRIQVNDPEISFELSSDDFNWILKAASVLSSPQIAVESSGDKVKILTFDVKNNGAHTESLEICDGDGSEYRVVFNTENLTKVLPGSYDVKISSDGISVFTNTVLDLKYFIALEDGSSYK